MKAFAPIIFVTLFLLATQILGCGKKKDQSISLPNTSAQYLAATGPNVLPIKVGGEGLCGKQGYQNELCTSIKICVPGTTQCHSVSDVLVDTGSIGLRVFESAIPFSLTQIKDSSGKGIAECAQFGTGSDWGPIVIADVILGDEDQVTTPIQIIKDDYATRPASCKESDSSPSQAKFNGILGIGLFKQDCGNLCAIRSANGLYFACKTNTDGTSNCENTTISISSQVHNPVALLAQDNNGLIVALPQIDTHGAESVSGVLILGVGTRANNQPHGVTSYSTDSKGNFTTEFQGYSFAGSFIDTGSNAIFFPDSSGIPACGSSGEAAKFYCPETLTSLSATNHSAKGTAKALVNFLVANANTLGSDKTFAFNDLAGKNSDAFDWGLPFFFGRAVVEGIEASPSTLGTGPYWAY